MGLSDYDFELPEEAIARFPLEERDASKLMALRRTASSSKIAHHTFSDLPALLEPGDLLVLNDSKVLRARLLTRKVSTGGAVELLFVEPLESGRWLAMAKSSKPLRVGARLAPTASADSEIEVIDDRGEGFFVVQPPDDLVSLLEAHGLMPLPPYLRREPVAEDTVRYQTVFAKTLGSVAAPTAGLHFTDALFSALAGKGIERASITLHVGPGTFLPVRGDRIEDHVMHSESFEIGTTAAAQINEAKRAGRRIIAVGTTVVRTLESMPEVIEPGRYRTDIFIKPPHTFRHVGGLVTNFHLPRSTLLMLVSAFLGRERILAAYAEAIARGYRFFSYGDAMVIL